MNSPSAICWNKFRKQAITMMYFFMSLISYRIRRVQPWWVEFDIEKRENSPESHAWQKGAGWLSGHVWSSGLPHQFRLVFFDHVLATCVLIVWRILPDIVSLYEKYHPYGLEIYAVSMTHKKTNGSGCEGSATALGERHRNAGLGIRFSAKIYVRSTPAFFLLDQGKYKWTNFQNWEIEKRVQEELARGIK